MNQKPYHKRGSIQNEVYQTLREEILNMVLEPGTMLSTQETASRLGVSRTPVREAFLNLQRDGLLEVEPQKGSRVSYIDMDQTYQERFVREALEVENLPLFLAGIGQEDLDYLHENVRLQRQALAEDRAIDYRGLDNEFHAYAMKHTGQFLAKDLVGQMNGHYDRVRLLSAWEQTIVSSAVSEHEQLLEYYRSGDVAAAQQLLRVHLQALKEQERTIVRHWPHFFTQQVRKSFL